MTTFNHNTFQKIPEAFFVLFLDYELVLRQIPSKNKYKEIVGPLFEQNVYPDRKKLFEWIKGIREENHFNVIADPESSIYMNPQILSNIVRLFHVLTAIVRVAEKDFPYSKWEPCKYTYLHLISNAYFELFQSMVLRSKYRISFQPTVLFDIFIQKINTYALHYQVTLHSVKNIEKNLKEQQVTVNQSPVAGKSKKKNSNKKNKKKKKNKKN